MAFDGEEIGQGRNACPDVTIASGFEDSAVIDKLRAGDAAAFDMLIDRYSSDIYALLLQVDRECRGSRAI